MAVESSNSANGTQKCRRCGEQAAEFAARQDMLCRDCFLRFIHTKVIKRMEAANLRVRDSTRDTRPRLLLPVSGGLSSLVLLHILDVHVVDQVKRTGRPGFDLVVLAVDDGEYEENELKVFLEHLKARYANHEFVFIPSTAPASTKLSEQDSSHPGVLDMTNVLASLKAPTSHSDIASLNLTHTIVRQAQRLHCDFILWGDTTTRLAEKILASTALGRGATLPSLVNDGPTPYLIPGSPPNSTTTTFLYPMKDVFRKELVAYSSVIDLPVMSEKSRAPAAVVSSKNATIDRLMQEYFASVEKDYPSIVANVVRTSSKLQIPPPNYHGSVACCELCGVRVEPGMFGIHGWGGSQEADDAGDATMAPVPPDPTSVTKRQLCYGCARSTLVA